MDLEWHSWCEPRALGIGERAYAFVCEHILFTGWEGLVRRRPTMAHLSYLRRSQWLSPATIEAIQRERLRRLLLHAQEHVPYYRELFAKIHFDPRGVTHRNDITVIPALTKEIVRERYADLLDPATRGKNLQKGTSGSTGDPFRFEYSHESDHWRLAMKLRGYEWAGDRIGLSTLHYWAQVYGRPRGFKRAKIDLDRFIKRDTFVDSMRQDEASMMNTVELIRRKRPHVIVCYTQSCAQLARFIVDRGLRDWPDIPVICGAEAVLSGDRAVLTQAFGPDIFETYGSRETMLMAAECGAHDGMHLSEETLVVEVTRDGALVEPGEPGDVLVTDLYNLSMPFIRYSNGDVARMAPDTPCTCGRGLRKLQSVDGRRADMLRDVTGHSVPGIVVHVIFSDARVEVVQQFQVVQEPNDEITFRVVRGRDFRDDLFSERMNRFQDYVKGVPIRVQFCDNIPPAGNGKRKTIVVHKSATNSHAP